MVPSLVYLENEGCAMVQACPVFNTGLDVAMLLHGAIL